MAKFSFLGFPNKSPVNKLESTVGSPVYINPSDGEVCKKSAGVVDAVITIPL